MLPDNATYHETVHFAGHVQGVGFRYTTMQVAREYEVTGYVANLLDGRVQLEVEGAEQEVKTFITALEERMHGYIRKTDRRAARRPPEFSSFVIR
jgi:acylphosphatase